MVDKKEFIKNKQTNKQTCLPMPLQLSKTSIQRKYF